MTQQDLSRAKNPDLRASLAAMRRAADMARSTAIQTNTEIVIVKDGKPVRVTAEELRQELGGHEQRREDHPHGLGFYEDEGRGGGTTGLSELDLG
jgi:hypothetical protein